LIAANCSLFKISCIIRGNDRIYGGGTSLQHQQHLNGIMNVMLLAGCGILIMVVFHSFLPINLWEKIIVLFRAVK